MNPSDIIKATAEGYEQVIAKAERLLAAEVVKMFQELGDKEAVLVALSKLDMEDFLLEKVGIGAEIDAILEVYGSGILRNMKMYGEITDEMLNALTELDRATLIANAKNMAGRVKAELRRGILAGLGIEEIEAGLADSFPPALAKTLANTLMNTFSRSVNLEMADSLPKTQKYIYEGPVDEVTRDICLEMSSAGPLTMAEIDSRFPGAFIDGGGFNCRHQWVPVETVPGALKKSDKAQRRVKEKKDAGEYQKPKTVLEKQRAKAV